MVDTFTIVQRVLFFSILAGTTLFFLWVLRSFLMPVFWAVVFAVLLYPSYQYLARKFHFRGNRSTASIVTILVTLVVVFAPLYGIGVLVANEAIDLYQSLNNSNGTYLTSTENIPYASEFLSLFNIQTGDVESIIIEVGRNLSAWLASEALAIGVQTFETVLKFLLMLYLLFFLLRDGNRLGSYLLRIVPLGDEKERTLFARFASTTRALIKGTVVVAIAQGVLGAILFSIAGIPNALLWGALMALAALIPALGPGIVWLPAGIILLALGNIWQGLLVLIGGALLVGLLDNVLRPVLVGRDTEMPDALILLAILGGLASFGIAGVIIGPVVAALLLSVWSLFEKEFHTELAERG